MAPVFEEEKILPIVEEIATYRMESQFGILSSGFSSPTPQITVFTFMSVS
jgi:hypothetical protein